jgi:outer membrane protein assembly factor BamB
VWSSSSIGRDGTSYFGSYDQNVYAVNADGTRQWAFMTGGTLGYGNAAAPAIASDGTLYVMADNDQGGSLLYALTPSGSQKWQLVLSGKLPSPGLLDAEDTFYFVESLASAGTLHALRADGTPLFSMPVGQPSAAPSLGADGTLYVGTDEGTLEAIGP